MISLNKREVKHRLYMKPFLTKKKKSANTDWHTLKLLVKPQAPLEISAVKRSVTWVHGVNGREFQHQTMFFLVFKYH